MMQDNSGLQALMQQVQPITGPASLDAVSAAMEPSVSAGPSMQMPLAPQSSGPVNPYPAGSFQGDIPVGLSPRDRAVIGEQLAQIVSAIGEPLTESDALVQESLQNALLALGMG